MEIKKSPKADLENGISLSLLLGLVVAISVVFVSLEWRSEALTGDLDKKAQNIADIDEALIVEDLKQEEPPPEEPPKEEPKVEQLPDELKVVEDDKKVAKIELVSADEKKPIPPPVNTGAQEEEAEDEIFITAEEPCEFPGGTKALYQFISDNMKYPEIALDNGVQGKVYVSFVVEKDGKATNVKILRGVDPALDKEAMRVIKMLPKFKPARQQGRPVRMSFRLPVVFKIQ